MIEPNLSFCNIYCIEVAWRESRDMKENLIHDINVECSSLPGLTFTPPLTFADGVKAHGDP